MNCPRKKSTIIRAKQINAPSAARIASLKLQEGNSGINETESMNAQQRFTIFEENMDSAIV
jgi:hypothetical protein